MTRRNTIEDFWNYVDIGRDDECWEWKGNIQNTGYGRFIMSGKHYLAHRFALSTVQDVPDDMNVCHKCDNPPCCNPSHLFAGTQADNVRDRDRKGRQHDKSGQLNPFSKLIECEVRFIRQSSISHKRLAEIFGVSYSTIYGIKTGQRWKHVL